MFINYKVHTWSDQIPTILDIGNRHRRVGFELELKKISYSSYVLISHCESKRDLQVDLYYCLIVKKPSSLYCTKNPLKILSHWNIYGKLVIPHAYANVIWSVYHLMKVIVPKNFIRKNWIRFSSLAVGNSVKSLILRLIVS